jgi:hypothetical protein
MTSPKKPKKTKSKKINVNARQKWEQILKTVTKDEVPVEMLESLTVNLIDGTTVMIDIKTLLEEGRHPRDIEEHINSHLSDLNDSIEDVDFFISIDRVSEVVAPMTDKILKNI